MNAMVKVGGADNSIFRLASDRVVNQKEHEAGGITKC
jgi:hypothetical protein